MAIFRVTIWRFVDDPNRPGYAEPAARIHYHDYEGGKDTFAAVRGAFMAFNGTQPDWSAFSTGWRGDDSYRPLSRYRVGQAIGHESACRRFSIRIERMA
jgi:hypothetical protein